MSAKETASHRWRLISIVIRQFRGISDEQTYAFNGRSGLLYGGNGVGKSTVALGLQWILYGRFPGGVLQNTAFDRFLMPVGKRGKSYSGEVIFGRNGETLTVYRDVAGELRASLGGKTWEGEDAAKKIDSVLGLDMDTFVRAVLLHQSRVRTLLLDDPKERNKALDRLLGMDVVEHLVEIVRPKDFEKAAQSWRAQIDNQMREHAASERLLAEQLKAAQERARNLKFQNKDLNPTGLEAQYAEVGKDLLTLGGKYKVDVEAIPNCQGLSQVSGAQRAFTEGVSKIRLHSDLSRVAVPLDRRIAALTSLRERWQDALQARDKDELDRRTLVENLGERAKLQREREAAEVQVQDLRRKKKATDKLLALLDDARCLVEAAKPEACPLCEQELPERLDLSERLHERIDKFASAETEMLEEQLKTRVARITAIDQILADFTTAEKELGRTQKQLVGVQESVVGLLGVGIAEHKLKTRIEEVLEKDEKERKALDGRLKGMEDELGAVGLREAAIREGLVPVIQKREEIAGHEKLLEKLQARHAKSAGAARAMEDLSGQLDAVKKALLDAKKELATDLLKKAGPRAQELYGRLVSQPVFDTLNVQASVKPGKVEYTFEVRSGNASGTARDARLVLSDGQLTATALALFFGLAESTAHQLDLLVVDDPTQNLDLHSKQAMAKVVAEVASRCQVIVATQDEDFVAELRNLGFANEAVVHHLKAWDGNPTVDTAVPS